MKPTDSAVVVAGGINVLKSSDGGDSMAEVSYWTGENNNCDDYVHADVHRIIFRPGHPNEAVIGSDGGVSYSIDLGSSSNPTFEDRNKDYNVTQFYSAAMENSDELYYLGGTQDNGTHQFTEANGLSTVEVTGGDGGFCFIDQDDSNVQISSFIRNVYFLLDGNGNFVRTLSSDQGSGLFINPADYDNESDVLFSAGNADELKRITGLSSSPQNQETLAVNLNGEQITALRADADSLQRVFVGTGSGGVYRIDSAHIAAPTVTDITGNISDFGTISSIDLGLTDDVIIVTMSNFGVNSVWYTTDGGAAWINKDNDGSLPDIPVRWALINPNNTRQVMLATELGVWSTNDILAENPDWEQTSQNLANVRCDMLQYRESDKLVVVATHGRGFFTSEAFAGPIVEAPSELSISQDEEGVRLEWVDNATNEVNYVIERARGDAAYVAIDTIEANAQFYVDASLNFTNELFNYRIAAIGDGGRVSNFAEASFLTLPGIPVLRDPTDVTEEAFTISWFVTDGTADFVLDVSTEEDFSSFLAGFEQLALQVTTQTISELEPATYYYRVAAVNDSGPSSFSETGEIVIRVLGLELALVEVYPNPATRFLTIESGHGIEAASILDLAGNMLLEVDTKERRVDLSSFSNGVYVLRIETGNGVSTHRIIKQ